MRCSSSCTFARDCLREIDWEFDSLFHIVDCNRTISNREGNIWFQHIRCYHTVRIQRKSHTSEWWWFETNRNPADMTTRPCNTNKLGKNSVWQRGPDFMYLPKSQWPIRQVNESLLPDRIGVTMTHESTKKERSPTGDQHRTVQ